MSEIQEHTFSNIEIQNSLAIALQREKNVEFAIMFGSRIKNMQRFQSDLDIAVYFYREPELLEIGNLVNKLERTSVVNVDLVILNKLYSKHPELAYNIISEGVLLVSNNSNLFAAYKRSVFLQYFDTKPLLDMYHQRFLQRLHANKFAER